MYRWKFLVEPVLSADQGLVSRVSTQTGSSLTRIVCRKSIASPEFNLALRRGPVITWDRERGFQKWQRADERFYALLAFSS
jgi:hypothetical protein